MTIRKHIPSQDYLTWTQQFSLFEKLSPNEESALQTSPEHFSHISCVRLFPDPFIDNATQPPIDKHIEKAIIVCDADERNQQIAYRLKQRLSDGLGVDLLIVPDDRNLDFWNTNSPIILIGGVQHNYWSKRLAQHLQLGVFNADFPGDGGWAVTTYQGITSGTGMRFVLCGEESVDYFLQNGVDPNTKQLQWMHEVHLSADLPEVFHDFNVWTKRAAKMAGTNLTSLSPDLNAWLHSDHKQSYREIFTKVLFAQRDRPIIYNASLLDIGLMAIRYYQFTGDAKALEIFREMLWGFWDYLTSDDPNIYISDMDFRVGQICSYWSWIEHHPSISAEERKSFRKLLLGAMRIVHAYYLQNWANRESAPGTRHNHQTFKGRCLLWGWRYFHQFNIADAQLWKHDADAVFSYMDAARSKYSENANNYETLVPEHLLTWYEISENEVDTDFQRALALFAYREWALTDNFYYRVEYGDCAVNFAHRKPFQVGPWLIDNNPIAEQIRYLERLSAPFSPEIPIAIHGFSKMHDGQPAPRTNHALIGWTRVPLEPKLESQFPLQGYSEERFDKLVWRSGWQDDAAYLAIEGFGNETVSHAHNATNSVIRANVGGRIWLVCNGYGKKINVASAAKAFSSRERGPSDHNMLILRDQDGSIVVPPVNALLIDQGNAPIPFAVTELPHYGGFTWWRHSFLLHELGFVFIDSLIPEADKISSRDVSLEWNILGSVDQHDSGATIEQTGTKLIFRHFETAVLQWDHNASADWHHALANKAYPHASNPLEKCVLKPTSPDALSKGYHFVSGFWLDSAVQHASWNPTKTVLELQCSRELDPSHSFFPALWGKIDVEKNVLRVDLKAREVV